MNCLPRTKRLWTGAEVLKLHQFANQKAGLETIANELGRSRGSVRQKAFWLGISLADDGLKAKGSK